MVTPKPDVDTHKYAENVEEQFIHLTNVKTITSVLIVMVITLQEAENVKLNKEKRKKAFWIKTKNVSATTLLMTFREKRPPKFLNILGEQSKTKVYEYFDRAMMCQNCLEYGHTTNRCHESTLICAQCNARGHSLKTCRRNYLVCHHCEDVHRSFSKNCLRYKQEIEITKIQTRERVSKTEAEQRLQKENPNKMNYAKATKQSSNTSAIPSTSANSDALDNDSNDTSETNPILRQEAKEIFEDREVIEINSEFISTTKVFETSSGRRKEMIHIDRTGGRTLTPQNAEIHGYFTKACPGQKRPASQGDQSPFKKNKKKEI